MTDDPQEGGIRPSVKPAISETQRVVALIGTVVFLLALFIVNVVMAVRCALDGDLNHASMFMLGALLVVVMTTRVFR